LSRGDDAGALALSQAAWQRWPDSQAITLAKVESQQKTGRDAEAIPFLQGAIKQWPDVPRLHQLLAQSQERMGRKVEARRSMAAYYDLTGALPTAVEQLQQARNMTKDFYIQSELDVQIRTLKERLKADRELLERFKS